MIEFEPLSSGRRSNWFVRYVTTTAFDYFFVLASTNVNAITYFNQSIQTHTFLQCGQCHIWIFFSIKK